jgi:hypothetical protein
MFFKNKKLFLGSLAGGIVLLLLLILLLNNFKNIPNKNQFHFSLNIPFLNKEKNPTKIIIKVGKENIYQKDLDFEMAYLPSLKNVDKKKLLLEKITKDSIILQAAQAENLIYLDTSVYNSPQKDYMKRINLIKEIKKKIEDKKDSISGSVIAIWFYDNEPAMIGYAKGKAIAHAKITKLHSDVVEKRITMEQAAAKIREDESLAQLDIAYKSNAFLQFRRGPYEKIVFDPDFDNVIKTLQPGQVSDIFLAKTFTRENHRRTNTKIDAVYLFAQVTTKTTAANNPGFDDWVTLKAKNYEITYY